MRKFKAFELFIIAVLACVFLAGGALGFALLKVRESVQTYTEVAQKAHPSQGDDVAALIAYVDSDTHELHERNLAVWALGRLGNPRALPTLERAYTGGPCSHSTRLCQYELAKAIKRCGGTPNPPVAEGH